MPATALAMLLVRFWCVSGAHIILDDGAQTSVEAAEAPALTRRRLDSRLRVFPICYLPRRASARTRQWSLKGADVRSNRVTGSTIGADHRERGPRVRGRHDGRLGKDVPLDLLPEQGRGGRIVGLNGAGAIDLGVDPMVALTDTSWVQCWQALNGHMRSSCSPNMCRGLIALIIGTLGLLLALASRGGASSTLPGTIVFTSNRDGDFDLYSMRPDGSGFRKLTRNAPSGRKHWDESSPAWSPDGRLIAFARRRTDLGAVSSDVYVMNADGSGERRITNNAIVDIEPDWTRDGKLVFFTYPTSRSGRRVALDLRRPRARPVTLGRVFGPLSPDGRLVLFARPERAGYDIYSVHLDGSGPKRLTHAPGDDGEPAWSPDGSRIVFVSERDRNGCFYRRCGGVNGFNGEIYVMNSDGSAQRRLTRHAGADITPTSSPDGTAIAFARQRDRNSDFEIMIMTVEGGFARAVTANSAEDAQPDWYGRG
jgi:Tol biopolymer transport system component